MDAAMYRFVDIFPAAINVLRAISSMAERRTHNSRDVGSNPSLPTRV